MDRLVGESIYNQRLIYRQSWVDIGNDVGLSDSGARKLAKEYALSRQKPWPLERVTKGGAIYSARKYGMTWLSLSRCYNDSIESLRRQAYKYARREGLVWPIQKLKKAVK